MTDTRRQKLFKNAMCNATIARRSYEYGWPIDRERQAQIATELDRRILESRREISDKLTECDLVAHSLDPATWISGFNPSSSKQLGFLLYTVLQEPVRRRTATGAPGTGKDSLTEIKDAGNPLSAALATHILAYKQSCKLRDAYIKNLQGIDLVRPQAHVTAQLSGRWSYKDPALQTTPPKIKPMFVAHPGCYLVFADLSQAELRNIAQLSGDSQMCRAYQTGRDIHAATAMAAFGCSPEQAKEKKFRNPAKVIGLGYNYSVLDDERAALGLHGQLIAKVPGITIESVLGILQNLRQDRAGVRRYKEALWAQAQQLDYVEEPLSGRRRYFWGKPKDTETFNFPCQAMTAEIVDAAIQSIDAEFRAGEGLHLQRHDELGLGGPDPHRLCELLWRHLRQVRTVHGTTLTYEIEYYISRRWGEGGVSIEPRPREGTYSSDETVCDCRDSQGETATVTGLRAAVDWAIPRVTQ